MTVCHTKCENAKPVLKIFNQVVGTNHAQNVELLTGLYRVQFVQSQNSINLICAKGVMFKKLTKITTGKVALTNTPKAT